MTIDTRAVRDYSEQEAKRAGAAAVEPIHVALALCLLLDYRGAYALLQAEALNESPVWPEPPVPVLPASEDLIQKCVDDIAAEGVLKELLARFDAELADAPASDEGSVEQYLAELDGLIGLGNVKREVRRLLAAQRANAVRVAEGQPAVPMSLHLVFTGDPGTGKTTVARIVGNLYRAADLLPNGHLIETDRSGLVGGFVGQTALKTEEVINQAMGGVLFIDEAYSLATGGREDYGAEAVATLVKAMEDRRSELAVIAAGYREQMQHFIDSNPGLKSRFKNIIHFPNYSSEELLQIFERLCSMKSFTLTESVRAAVLDRIQSEPVDTTTGNARFIRSIFEDMFANMAERAQADGSLEMGELLAFTVADVPGLKDRGPNRPPVGFTN